MRKKGLVIGTGMLPVQSMVTPDGYGTTKNNNASTLFNNSKSVRVPRMGLGRATQG